MHFHASLKFNLYDYVVKENANILGYIAETLLNFMQESNNIFS